MECCGPDILVRLPGDKTIVVDSKTPVAAYLDALEAPDDAKRAEMPGPPRGPCAHPYRGALPQGLLGAIRPNARVRRALPAGRNVLFRRAGAGPTLIEYGAEKRVILATPTTLIALLKAIFFGWRQQKLAGMPRKSPGWAARSIPGSAPWAGTWKSSGKSLGKSVESYNQAVASLETRVMVKARTFKDLEVGSPDSELEPLEQVDIVPRQLQAPEFTEGAEAKLIRALEEKEEEP